MSASSLSRNFPPALFHYSSFRNLPFLFLGQTSLEHETQRDNWLFVRKGCPNNFAEYHVCPSCYFLSLWVNTGNACNPWFSLKKNKRIGLDEVGLRKELFWCTEWNAIWQYCFIPLVFLFCLITFSRCEIWASNKDWAHVFYKSLNSNPNICGWSCTAANDLEFRRYTCLIHHGKKAVLTATITVAHCVAEMQMTSAWDCTAFLHRTNMKPYQSWWW